MEERGKEIVTEGAETKVQIQETPYKSGSVQYIDSREVAEMVGKDHKHLLRDIRKYCDQMKEINQHNSTLGEGGKRPQSNLGLSDFFMESSYVDMQGKERPCYFVTEKGCEFIAHKLTGLKGTEFTVRYINRFHEMKDELAGNAGSLNFLTDAVKEFMKHQMETSKQQMEFNQKIMERLERLEHRKAECGDNPYCDADESYIESRKKEIYTLTSKVAELCGISHTKVLHYMYRALERYMGIVLDSYKSVYRSETGRWDASMVEVIAANDKIYKITVEMNQSVIERKRTFG